MRSDPMFADLLDEFPELASENVVIEKELYAHFGLLFFSFALVEHSLINFAVFEAVGKGFQNGAIRSRAEWENTFDQNFNRAKSLSLGNLIKSVKSIPEIASEIEEISAVKSNRDYFAHHFFRDEIAYFKSDQRGWLLLNKLRDVRHQTHNLEDLLKRKFDLMCKRFNLPRPTADQLASVLADYEEDSMNAASRGTVKFGWES
ncbi:hypothetical protein LP421_28690 [Rhizobium sp. RCAM05350]|nr:hypothetical protein LP421_28690 [Rhizobium sp. RCAM05350]